jgi:phospholipase C
VSLTRRQLLRAGAAGGAGVALPWLSIGAVVERARATMPQPGATLRDIEHVVILMQENRSFDHYFGKLRGVRGFGDPAALVDVTGRSVFDQVDADLADNPSGHLLPWRLDTTKTAAQALEDITHAWSAMHFAWNHGQMDGFVTTHRVGDGNGPGAAPGCMGYFTRADLPFHYALADAFTICDNYFCSVLGPTNPNRIMSMSATTDAAGVKGGPCIDNSQQNGQLRWTSYPERLQAAGIDWFVYQESDNDGNNMLPLFAAFNDVKTDLYRRGNTVIPTPKGQRFGPALAARLKRDVVTGNLPQVSWILASGDDCEHPNAMPASGARFVASVLDALTADPKVWAKTVVFYTFDENGGFFDHVVPPTPPPATADEFLSNRALVRQNPMASFGINGPVGLGFRVPTIVISPFSRGGFVNSDTFDHTSLLRFLEARFGVEVPNLSDWRRSVTGDLTTTLGCRSAAEGALPPLPDAVALEQAAAAQVKNLPAPQPNYSSQSMPVQEPGPRTRTRGVCADGAAGASGAAAHALSIDVRGVPAHAVKRGFRVHVAVTHSVALASVEVKLNGRQIVRGDGDRVAFNVRADQLRAGRNRLAITAVDADGRRARRALVVLRGA